MDMYACMQQHVKVQSIKNLLLLLLTSPRPSSSSTTATAAIIITIIIILQPQPPPDQPLKIDPDLGQLLRLLVHDVHALVPHAGAALDAAELARQDGVEAVEVLFRPLDAGRGHGRREALLVDADGVFDHGEVDEGDLEDVEGEVAFEDALSGFLSLVWL